MQSMNMQPHVFPMGEHSFFQQGDQQPAMGIAGNQIYSPQVVQARLLQQQQPTMMQGIPALTKSQEISNSYILKQKLEAEQHQQQQQQQFNIGNPVGVAANGPPGLNGFRQAMPTLNRLGKGQLPKHIAGAASATGPPVLLPPPGHFFIREVWKNNLHSEFSAIRKMACQYNYISVSTEFVGTIARPIGNFRSKTDYHYQTMRSNVDFLNPIQIGISLCDANGAKPDNGPSTWQFNFNFDQSREMMSAESFELLQRSGINFESHSEQGVDSFEFAQLMIDSGLLMEPNTTWITYHAAYDFGFLVHILMNDSMPNNREEFEWWVHKFLPNFFDLNLICKVIQDYKQQQHPGSQQQQQFSLASLAEELGIPKFPLFTTTGGQSLLTLMGFFQLSKLSMNKLPNGLSFSNYKNLIYGINGE
ncbi:POP2 (YNR052C) [Zygosaccharomyces parabailii]|uniref:poly(A)-specific ribonuclease n=1 Tax=Zygosaccharomyces bailii (strain CLIB 213 / ATCC 58445 / CBS 680 / BCRC 21525 / NBRC 1098 / NCYC 1416 / NRRL Y-2227) TaxID=1333698 RepID=A0A8J2T1Q4_ZYGB2|nr:POP2 (YNR052C) [Zygosaccharomyces parabailii]CDF88028.1 BN860_00650g1_1 [Zygosaccharomyces bailii CLIB 213]CDH14450.1 related to Poly(A) ribonuclease POP2 [Zygosaccharomyces bailii ISA1307]SJM87335.1 related to Poly(A) ribonuclease POP2 [Zygosaccharomyces bailii]